MDFGKLTRSHTWWRIVTLFAITLILSVCSDDETTPVGVVPAIAVTGSHSVEVGASVTLTATTRDGADSAYTWESSRKEIATVDQAGTVTGVALGETTITVKGVDSGAIAKRPMVVVPTPEQTIIVAVTGNPFVEVGSSVTLTATTTGAEDTGYTWTSSDGSIAAVDDQGIVIGNYAGDVIITATGNDTGVSGSMQVAVRDEIPHYDEWLASAHADNTAEAFNHWNNETPPEIPTDCARCHSTPGYQDYLGADGTTAEVVDNAAPIGSVIECGACHNDVANTLAQVTFPSGEIVDALGAEARCMVCHQGRASGDDVDEAITTAAVTSDDEASTSLGFLNIHYYAAGATLNAGRVRGGYQYAGEVYDWRFRHVPGYDTCIGCHNPHSLEVKVDECAGCHAGVTSLDDLKDIRMIASLNQDYDGDSNTTEGIYHEMQGLKAMLLTAIQTYTVEKSLGAICYDELAYPYWFKDTNADGACDSTEADYANRFAPFTARLMRATYNYQVATKDPGAFAHNAKYMIQLLYDATANINLALTAPVDLTNAVRNDFGHFNGASEAARHWDADEAVSSSCSKCHGGSEGYRFFLQYGVGTAVVEPDNGLDCATCHDTFANDPVDPWAVVKVDSVTYPSGIKLTDVGNVSNICSTCHSGRESKKTIDDAIAANQLSFRNVHYLPAAAVKEGTGAKVGYEYPSKIYAAEWTTHGKCVNCHDPVSTNHSFHPTDNPSCNNGCHQANGPMPIVNIRVRTTHLVDFDGDANAAEPLKDEITGLANALIAQMAAVSGTPPICYNEGAYPYFFKDTNANGLCETSESINANKWTAWTPALMKAAHNYQISKKEHGAWAHNFDYMAQLLYDSIENLGGNVSTFIRP